MKFNITELIMKFSHEIDADKAVFTRTDNPKRTLLGQLEDEINNIIKKDTSTDNPAILELEISILNDKLTKLRADKLEQSNGGK